MRLLIVLCAVGAALAGHDDPTDVMIRNAGYEAESHLVTTEDCYILTVHRIPSQGKPIFLQHGLLSSSADWVVIGPDHGALAFMLADAGYDVWIGNFRGNTYSKAHCTMTPHDDLFWEFSWDEMAKYDLPAMMNHVLNRTGSETLLYVGHSMGTTTFMALNNIDPSWADKVEMASLFAPVAHVDHMKSPIKYIAPFADSIQWILEHLGIGEFLPSNWLMDFLASFACGNDWLDGICENVMFVLCGFDKAQVNETMLPDIVHHAPAGTSTYTVLQYAQQFKHKAFKGFDWGNRDKNIVHHGSPDPPVYSLEAVTANVSLFWSDNDWLAQPQDLLQIVTKVPYIYSNTEIAFEKWNHLDFLWAIDIVQYLDEPFMDVLSAWEAEANQ